VAAQLVLKLLETGVEFEDYPNLIRLNPNIPYKTRGNGAVCLRLKNESMTKAEVFTLAKNIVNSLYEKNFENTNPGLAVFSGTITHDLQTFAHRALTEVCHVEMAQQIAKEHNITTAEWGNGRGLIGAIAAIGNTLEVDHTFEVLAFRTKEHWNTPRKVNLPSIFRMNQKTFPYTFNNVDEETHKALITPNGPDPVLYGIRGETPRIVYEAHKQVKAEEPREKWLIFRTNQGTDAHFTQKLQIEELRPYIPAIVEGTVVTAPKTILGGHVFFDLADSSGSIPCAAYEPSGKLRNVVRALIRGDRVRVFGGIRPPSVDHPLTLNLEKLTILELSSQIEYVNPICSECGKRMKSAGRGKGYKCRCGKKVRVATKIGQSKPRQIQEGTYYPPPRSMRHLGKPQQRIGYEKSKKPEKLVVPWHNP